MDDVKETEPLASAEPTDFASELVRYRRWLASVGEKMQGEYDKAVMALSGGALGLSLAFLKDILKGVEGKTSFNHAQYLLGAWLCWGVSILAVLFSFYSSVLAANRAAEQFDERTIYLERVGGFANRLTKVLNPAGGILFLAGVALLVTFVSYNLI